MALSSERQTTVIGYHDLEDNYEWWSRDILLFNLIVMVTFNDISLHMTVLLDQILPMWDSQFSCRCQQTFLLSFVYCIHHTSMNLRVYFLRQPCRWYQWIHLRFHTNPLLCSLDRWYYSPTRFELPSTEISIVLSCCKAVFYRIFK